MGIQYSNEKLLSYPIPEDGVSFSKVAATGINTFISMKNKVFGGGYSFDSVTITLKGITDPPFEKPPVNGIGDEFTFRNRTWTILDVQEGAKFKIAGTMKYSSWSVTAVDLNSGRVIVS